ncbi:MAG: GNAT family N-acetyltransferase [Caldilineaceae bacterium]|nr:GNAT family N-acetyltransferase [Caldilineaceae bacterium]
MMIKFEAFNAQDFAEYATWFADAQIAKELGPLDPDLATFLGTEPETWNWIRAVHQDGQLACMVQVVRDGSTTEGAITIAVAPQRQRRGIATAVLQAILCLPEFSPIRRFSALVRADNEKSRRLVETVGFQKVFPLVDDNGYFEYAFYR